MLLQINVNAAASDAQQFFSVQTSTSLIEILKDCNKSSLGRHSCFSTLFVGWKQSGNSPDNIVCKEMIMLHHIKIFGTCPSELYPLSL